MLVPLAFFLAVTWSAADFGYHWDEPWGQVRPLKIALERHSPITGYYIYPGLNLWLNAAALAPDYLASGDLIEAVQGRAFLLRARKLRMAVAGLAIVWVYLLVLALGRSVPEALLAASLLGLSWEAVYHSRWLAPDSVLMQFGVLAVGCAVLAEKEPHRGRWTLLAAVTAGLACGVKYPGGLLLLPAVLVVVARPGTELRERLKHVAKLGIVFAVTFLLTTPAALLDFRQFRSQLIALKEIYGDEGWFGYTVESPHLGKLLSYLASSALSPLPAIGWALFGCAIWGAVCLVKANRRTASILLAFPAAYAAYFSLQNVMIVRNYQVLIPFVALCTAVGIGDVWRRLPAAGIRSLWALGTVAAVTYHAGWQIEACRGIVNRADLQAGLRELDAHIRDHPGDRFFLSERIAEALVFLGVGPRPNVVEEASRATVVVASLRELGSDFPANRGILEWFGPREVDLDRYPTWEGQDRPVTMRMTDAVDVPLALSQLVRRRAVFPDPLAHGRQALLLAGDERAGDQLYVESTPRGGWLFGLESWGGDRASPFEVSGPGPRGLTDSTLSVEPGRSYLLEIDWGIARDEIRVTLDGRLVFSRYGPLYEARLDEVHTGAAAALPGRKAAAYSGTLEPVAETGEWRPLAAAAADPLRLAFADGPGHALPASPWVAASEELEASRHGESLVVLTPRERFAEAAWYGPVVLPEDGQVLFAASFEAEGYSPLGPRWHHGGLALGVLSEDRSRWLAFRRTAGRISELDPILTIRYFARAGEPVWLVALSDQPGGRGTTRLTLGKLDAVLRPQPFSRLFGWVEATGRPPSGVWRAGGAPGYPLRQSKRRSRHVSFAKKLPSPHPTVPCWSSGGEC